METLQDTESSLIELRLQLVMRVTSSPTFIKSERLSALLIHLCKLSLNGRAADLYEQKIGQDVFGRNANYDSGGDGIVRTQASRLRQRLAAHFSGDGAHEPIRIVLPRGGYVPVFEPNLPNAEGVVTTIAVDENAIPAPVETFAPRKASQLPRRLIGMSIAFIVLIVAGALFIRRESRGVSSRHGDEPLWDAMFSRNGHILLIPGDSSLVIWQWAMNRDLDLPAYIEGSYRKLGASPTLQEREAVALANRRYTSVVDAEIAKNVGVIAGRRGGGVDLRYARDVQPNDLKDKNVILIGSAEANPWLRLYEPSLNFVFSVDRNKQIYSVLNRARQSGEPNEWNIESGVGHNHVDALVAYLPNVGGGDVLILEGTDMAGTECAWEFVSDEQAILPLMDQIRRPDGKLKHFEVVLATRNVNGSAVQSSIVAYRTYP